MATHDVFAPERVEGFSTCSKIGVIGEYRGTSSRREGIGPFHGEAGFADLWRVCGGDAGELRSDVVDDVEIAIGTVVVPQAQIGADCLSIRCVHLKETREGQKSVEGIVPLQTRQDRPLAEICLGALHRAPFTRLPSNRAQVLIKPQSPELAKAGLSPNLITRHVNPLDFRSRTLGRSLKLRPAVPQTIRDVFKAGHKGLQLTAGSFAGTQDITSD